MAGFPRRIATTPLWQAARSATVGRVNAQPRRRWWQRDATVGVIEPDTTEGSFGLIWLFFAAVWLGFLVDPLLAAAALADPVRRVAGFVITLLFAAAYLWHFALSRQYTWLSDVAVNPVYQPGNRLARYAVLVALAAADTAVIGQRGAGTWVFVAVAGMWTFRIRTAILVAIGLSGLYELLALRLPGWQSDVGLVLSMALAVLAVTGGIVASRRARDLREVRLENAGLAVQDERNRMARDLHDILGHSLTVITVKAELAARLVTLDPARAQAEIEDVERLAREALGDVRGAVEGFREISLSRELVRARSALTSAGIRAELPTNVDVADPSVRELYAWTIREGVTNVIRHSGATVCRVVVDAGGLTLSDDGSRAQRTSGPTGRSAGGNGLRGLAERARAVGAELSTAVGSDDSSDDGFRIEVRMAGRRATT